MKQKPDFLIVGAMKSGTTALYEYLSMHPSIVSANKKELHYYNKSRYIGTTLSDYIKMFSLRNDCMLSGEATPFYLRHTHAPKWIKKDFPHIKIIIILRNPTSRAYSHYQQRLNNGKETGFLIDAMHYELNELEGEWDKFNNDEDYLSHKVIEHSYLSRGRYLEQIKNWMKYFSKDQICIIFNEELENSQLETLNKLAIFLGLPKYCESFKQPKIYTRKYDPIDKNTKDELDFYFEPYNKALFKFLNKFPLW